MTRTEQLETAVMTILRPWLEPERKQDNEDIGAYHQELASFIDWANHYEVDIGAGGPVIAAYLIELFEAGALLPDLVRVAGALDFFFRRFRLFLDVAPIDAALEYAAAQTADDRVLH
jgi:hypothetical protein